MKSNILRLQETGLAATDILIPKKVHDLSKWAVVACDQYTSEPEYWEEVAKEVGDEPSTLNLIFPEVYLGQNDALRIKRINATMDRYLQEGIFDTYEHSIFLIRRTTPVNPAGRWGLVAALDLEQYDYSPDSKSPVRATEGTILERIPPRKEIRRDAPLELPHILVLIDDEEKTVIEPLIAETGTLEKVYDVELMQNGGHITAFRIHTEALQAQITAALQKLASPAHAKARYGVNETLLYAMGAGNHSLATAKSCWEDIKQGLSPDEQADHPARFALVEIENIYDPGITFEPIHRVLFNSDINAFLTLLGRFCEGYSMTAVDSLEKMDSMLSDDSIQCFGLKTAEQFAVVRLEGPSAEIAAGTLQLAIDALLEEQNDSEVDYTHGEAVTASLGERQGNIALFLPAISKAHFFQAIVSDGALPRKTFSMGEAAEKRYYMEARGIR